uniref:Uncharacterized protein LOC123614709 n=1 Tax=Camelus bactrianus TaxID=9837 RepID=A0A9W3HCW5_CAMBA|nr:uncharacterized protein LOC123614709 [Camelus bactrianus]
MAYSGRNESVGSSERHLTAGWSHAKPGKPKHRKRPAVSGKNPTEQKLRGRISEIRPAHAARSAPRRLMRAFAQARGLPLRQTHTQNRAHSSFPSGASVLFRG